MRHTKDEQIKIRGETLLWALARDLRSVIDEPRHSMQFRDQEIGRAIREAYIAGMNVEGKLSNERSLRHFDEQMKRWKIDHPQPAAADEGGKK